MGLFRYEDKLIAAGLGPVAGVDEAGRGACAGPLVAAAVVLDGSIPGLADSKALTQRRREELFEVIMRDAAAVAFVQLSPAECDRYGVHKANLEAMRRAVLRLDNPPGFVLVDGYALDGLPMPSLAVHKGDAVVESISAASIVAKVVRDAMMEHLNEEYPGYGFAAHKGYGTAAHQEAMVQLGPSDIHRWSYRNVREAARQRASKNELH